MHDAIDIADAISFFEYWSRKRERPFIKYYTQKTGYSVYLARLEPGANIANKMKSTYLNCAKMIINRIEKLRFKLGQPSHWSFVKQDSNIKGLVCF